MPAEQILTKGLRRAPNDYRLLAALGQANATEKQYDAAIDYYRRSVAIAPQENIAAARGDVLSLRGIAMS